jgi:hypothetical protein
MGIAEWTGRSSSNVSKLAFEKYFSMTLTVLEAVGEEYSGADEQNQDSSRRIEAKERC